MLSSVTADHSSSSSGFSQQSAPPAEEEALPGSTAGQDGEPDREPGAHGEHRRRPPEISPPWGYPPELANRFSLSQVQDMEFAQIEIKVIQGLKVGNECLKKMHEVGGDVVSK